MNGIVYRKQWKKILPAWIREFLDTPCECGHFRWRHWFIWPSRSYCMICGEGFCDQWRPMDDERSGVERRS